MAWQSSASWAARPRRASTMYCPRAHRGAAARGGCRQRVSRLRDAGAPQPPAARQGETIQDCPYGAARDAGMGVDGLAVAPTVYPQAGEEESELSPVQTERMIAFEASDDRRAGGRSVLCTVAGAADGTGGAAWMPLQRGMRIRRYEVFLREALSTGHTGTSTALPAMDPAPSSVSASSASSTGTSGAFGADEAGSTPAPTFTSALAAEAAPLLLLRDADDRRPRYGARPACGRRVDRLRLSGRSAAFRDQPASSRSIFRPAPPGRSQFPALRATVRQQGGYRPVAAAFEVDLHQAMCLRNPAGLQRLSAGIEALGAGMIVDNCSLETRNGELQSHAGVRLAKLDRRLSHMHWAQPRESMRIAGLAQLARVGRLADGCRTGGAARGAGAAAGAGRGLLVARAGNGTSRAARRLERQHGAQLLVDDTASVRHLDQSDVAVRAEW